MTTRLELRGILPAMVTPFTADGLEIDVAALRELTERLVSAGCGGLIPGGSTGEFSALSHAERKLLHETVIDAAAGRIPVIAQTGALSTREAIELSKHAEAYGAAALMVVPPYYEGHPFHEVKQYYMDVASSVSIPVMLYHIPNLTGVVLDVEQFAELANIPGVEMVKDSSANASAMFKIAHDLEGRLQVYNGWDTLAFASLASGIKAMVWGAANIFPELAVELYETVAVKRDMVAGLKLWDRLYPLVAFLEAADYNARVKASVGMTGLDAGPTRRPILPISNSDRATLAEHLDGLGIPVSPAVGHGSAAPLMEV